MVKATVSNSTPLIYLAKIEKVELLKEIFEKVYIPEEVFEESVVKGRELSKKEVFPLEELIEEGFIEVKGAARRIKGIETLHKGEMEAISLAKDLKIKTLLIDDREGLGVARVFGLQPRRTTAVLLMFYRDGIIDYKELCDSLLRLSEEGYFMKAEVYNELIKKAGELK
ncbi:MAG: hypothetical protein ACE5PM_07630 [Candidatus Hydrothermarchaeales archaeon]